MRLKLLFFPIMMIISVAILIAYIWPEIDNLKIANQEKMSAAESLQAVISKQEAIKSLGNQISEDSEGAAVVDNYLPKNKVEERIIGGINYLANDSQVSLADISLRSPESVNVPQAAPTGTAAAITSSVNTLATATIPESVPVYGQAVGEGGMQFSQASITVVGSYEKLRLFIDQIQRMSLLNKIKSLAIKSHKAESDEKDGSSATDLTADMVIDFGYLEPLHSDNSKLAQIKPEMDKDTISTLEQYISQKTSLIALPGSDTGSKGRPNPFLP